MTAYAELQCTTNFSFLRGASHPEELVTQARHLGLAAIAVTDRNTLAGVVRAHGAAKDMDLKLIVGARLSITEKLELLCYPTTRAAYGRLCRLLSTGQRRAEKGRCILTLEDIYEYADGLIFALLPDSAGHLETIRKHLKAPLYLAVHRLYGAGDRARINRLAELAHKTKTPLVATNDVLYHHPSRRMLQDVVTAIREPSATSSRQMKWPACSATIPKPSPTPWRLQMPATSPSTNSNTNIPTNPPPRAPRRNLILSISPGRAPRCAIRRACQII
jgi:error-prone DNA polymerase